MNWDAIGAIAELFGAAGVVLSLLYLSIQMRQSNRLAKRAATQGVLAARAEVNRFLASDPVLNELVWRGMESPDDLDENEWKRFINAFIPMIRHCEAIFLDHQEGLLRPGTWRSQESSMRRWLSMPGAQRIISQLEPDFEEAFVRHVVLER